MKKRTVIVLLALALSMASLLHADCPFGLLSPSHFPANVRPGDVATGDFNNNGYDDLAVVNRQTSTISILLGSAGGVFGAPTQVVLSSSTQDDIQAVDFNKDGNIDLVVAIHGTDPPDFSVLPQVEVFLGHGNGTFTAVGYTGQQYVRYPTHMALGDFDNDGMIDVAVAKQDGMFSSMKNVGGGVLAQTSEYTTAESNGFATGVAAGIAVGDFDGDGKLDIAVSEAISRKIYLFFGNGDGTYVKSPNTIDLPAAQTVPGDIHAGDFNGDGKDDLAIILNANGGPDTPPLKIALSNGVARTFATPVDYDQLQGPTEVLVRDIDGDGKLDVLVAEEPGVSVFRGIGDGTFAAKQTFSMFATGLAIGDFDGDGGPDVVGTNFGGGQVDIALNTCGRITLNLTSSANPAVQGTPITITGTVVSSPAATGTLTLKRSTTVLNSGNLNAGNSLAATMTGLSPATYPIIAEYSGDSRFLAASRTIQQVVTMPPFGPPPGLNAISFGGPVQISWIATANTDHYEIWRYNGAGSPVQIGTASIAAYTDSTAPASSALLYKVRAMAAGGAASEFSSDLALTYTFTDGTLQAGVTPVKLAHLTELRSAANAVRALAGQGPVSWADASPVIVQASHVAELRTAVNQARTALGMLTAAFTDSTLTAGSSTIRAVHFEELRASMR